MSQSDQEQQELEALIGAFTAKIKQDKLDQRRTVLSAIDQSFVYATIDLAHAAGIEVEPSIKRLDKRPQVTDETPKSPEGDLETEQDEDGETDSEEQSEPTPGPSLEGNSTADTVAVEELRPDPKSTNKELKAFMDEHGIAYEGDDNKASLNLKIDNWVNASRAAE